MKAIIAMFTATLIASLYPLAAALGINNFDPFAFVFVTSFVSFLTSLGIVLIWTKKIKKEEYIAKSLQSIDEESAILILITSLCTTLCHIFFVYSLNFMSKAGAAIIFESWPVFTMVLAPLLIKKTWNKLEPKHIILSMICMLGVFFIGVSDQQQYFQLGSTKDIINALDFDALIGMVLALMGSITASISAIYRGKLSQIWNSGIESPMLRVSISECITRFVGLPIAIGCYLFLGEAVEFNATTVTSILFIGIATYTGVNILYTYALMESHSSSINIMWYIMPVLSVIWLYAFGLSSITMLIILGMSLIVISNLTLLFSKPPGEKQKKTAPL